MTRFAASTAGERQTLIADAIAAHRERASQFCTVEAEPVDPETPPPWIQYADGVLNLDCTDAELERLKELLEGYPAFTVDKLTRPDAAEGVNVRITARADDDRMADAIDTIFEDVYERESSYRLWAIEV